jgi:hypothetical protein
MCSIADYTIVFSLITGASSQLVEVKLNSKKVEADTTTSNTSQSEDEEG